MKEFSIARHKYERLYLFLTIVTVISILYFFYDLNAWITILAIFSGLFYIRLVQGQYLGNALQVSNKHFYRIKQIIEDQSKMLEIMEPNVFINQDPYPNAYTLGFKNPYTIVLTSSLIENLNEDELEAVIAHEMGHAKFHHPRISSVVNPAGKNIPIFTWLFGFWERSAEISADNISLFITENPRALVTSLFKISIGPKFLGQIDEEELLKQSSEIKLSMLNKLGELLNNHPYLTTRISNLISKANIYGFSYYKGGKIYCSNCGKQISVSAKYCPHCGYPIKMVSEL